MGDGVETQYYPPPEADGGWRWCRGEEQLRDELGFDPDALRTYLRLHDAIYGGHASSIAIIRNGWLAVEHSTINVASSTRFDLWSVTKSFTAAAWGVLLAEREERSADSLSLDTPAYELIRAGWPLSDPRKAKITIRHLLSMTSGIPGETSGINGMPNAVSAGVFEHALGDAPNRYGQWVDRLVAQPGEHWEYSDAAYAHLSLAFVEAAGAELADFFGERVLRPIGVTDFAWDRQGGSGFLGPHTNAHTGLHLSARDLARFGYLALHGGVWEGEQRLPAGWVSSATSPSQEDNLAYGFGWWTNTAGRFLPGLPADLFALAGYNGNRCFVVPSLDLVVARTATGPSCADDRGLLAGILRALT